MTLFMYAKFRSYLAAGCKQELFVPPLHLPLLVISCCHDLQYGSRSQCIVNSLSGFKAKTNLIKEMQDEYWVGSVLFLTRYSSVWVTECCRSSSTSAFWFNGCPHCLLLSLIFSSSTPSRLDKSHFPLLISQWHECFTTWKHIQWMLKWLLNNNHTKIKCLETGNTAETYEGAHLWANTKL